MDICYFTSKEGIGHQLETSWNNQHNLVRFNSDIQTLIPFDAICLVEPYECLATLDDVQKAGPYISIYHVWKKYLAEEAPNVKLLILRYTDEDHLNIVPLLTIHPSFDWAAKINRAISCGKDWDDFPAEPLPTAEKKLKLFFKGHNNFGFVDVVARVRQYLNHFYHELGQQGEDAFPQLFEKQILPHLEDLRLLFYRWRIYQPYFKAMPFWNELKNLEIDSFLSSLLEACSMNLLNDPNQNRNNRNFFLNLNAYERLDKIQKQLNFFNKKYITPEMMGEVLIVDDDPSFQKLMKNAFPVYRFTSAYSVSEGIEKISKHPSRFKFVILDLNFSQEGPKDEGLAVLEWIKNHQPHLVVIVISTNNSTHLHKIIIEMGATFFLSKSEFHIRSWDTLFLKALVEGEKNDTQRIFTPRARSEFIGHVLLIDDDNGWTNQIKDYFSRDFRFTVANTSQQAKDLVHENKDYDLIMSDIILDDYTDDIEEGIKLIKFFRNTAINVPVVAISRLSYEALIERTIAAGVQDFLRKDHFNFMIWRQRMTNYIGMCKKCKEQASA